MPEETKNIGLYICSGCHIGEALEPGRLEALAGGYEGVKVCRIHSNLCSSGTRMQVNDEIREKGLNALVIAACSPRNAPDTLKFNGILTEYVNLREGVSWVMEPRHEDTLTAAEDYLRMGIARTLDSRLPTPYVPRNPSSGILVIGGGITGIQAALDGARAGYRVTLVEKEDRLGGWLNHWHDIIPASGSRQTNLDYFLGEKLDELTSSPLITVHKNTRVLEISGEPGNFQIRLLKRDSEPGGGKAPTGMGAARSRDSEIHPADGKATAADGNASTGNGEDPTEDSVTRPADVKKQATDENVPLECRAGAIVLANGWKPYDASRLTKLGFGIHQNLVTQADLEAMARQDCLLRPSDKKIPENVLFIQCAGSRDEEHLPYCSNVCCLTSLKQALYIRRKHPETNVFIVYKDIRTPGRNEHFYREVQEDSRIFLIKGEIAGIRETENKDLSVTVSDNLLGEPVNIDAGLVVAATGMEPNRSEDLHLSYRKGGGLPERRYGFPDSHFICFPYETQRTGIYAAGAVRAPQGIQECMEDAGGAMAKAIQCIECIKRGESVHPRSGDQSFPELYMDRCTDCKRCTEECPFGSYDETEKGTPLPHPARCRRCGICMGSCPERIINFDNYSIRAVSSMIKSIPIPDEFEEKPRILAFVCENDACPALDMAARYRHRISPWLRIIPVRCIGSVNRVWISDALSAGYDGILQIGCKPGDDYQCHYITGSELMETRAGNIQETLQTMMLEPERVETIFLEIDEYHKIPGIIDAYLETIETIGPNPFKGM